MECWSKKTCLKFIAENFLCYRMYDFAVLRQHRLARCRLRFKLFSLIIGHLQQLSRALQFFSRALQSISGALQDVRAPLQLRTPLHLAQICRIQQHRRDFFVAQRATGSVTRRRVVANSISGPAQHVAKKSFALEAFLPASDFSALSAAQVGQHTDEHNNANCNTDGDAQCHHNQYSWN